MEMSDVVEELPEAYLARILDGLPKAPCYEADLILHDRGDGTWDILKSKQTHRMMGISTEDKDKILHALLKWRHGKVNRVVIFKKGESYV